MKIKSTIAVYCLFATAFIVSCVQSPAKEQQFVKSEMQVDSCNNLDANVNCCFVNMPSVISSVMTIASKPEPGDPLIISGTIYNEDSKTPCRDIWLYAYHTDHTGRYTKNGTETGFQKWHGRMHGWCKTDSNGHYEIQTIRPAPYPDNSMPAHIHAAVKMNNGQSFYINDFVFKDDPLVNEKYLATLKDLPGGNGVVDLTKSVNHTWIGKRNISLYH